MVISDIVGTGNLRIFSKRLPLSSKTKRETRWYSPAEGDGLDDGVAAEAVLVERLAELGLLRREGADDALDVRGRARAVDDRRRARGGRRLREGRGRAERDGGHQREKNSFHKHSSESWESDARGILWSGKKARRATISMRPPARVLPPRDAD
jgi:hypothetical protein